MFFKRLHVKCHICKKIAHVDELEEAGHRGCISGRWCKYLVHPSCAIASKEFKDVIEEKPRRWVYEHKQSKRPSER